MPTDSKLSSDGPGVYGLSHLSYGSVSPAGHAKFQEVYTSQKIVQACASRSPEDLNSLLLLVGGIKLLYNAVRAAEWKTKLQTATQTAT